MKINAILAVLIAAAPVLEAKRGGGAGGGPSNNNGNTRTDSNKGGRSDKDGSGDPRPFCNGEIYPGGSGVPFTSGKASRGVIPRHITAEQARNEYGPRFEEDGYVYLTGDFTYLNESNVDASHPHGTNETVPSECLCKSYQVCGCEENLDPVFVEELLSSGKGWWTRRNGISISCRDGSLANGTTAPSAAGRNSALHKGGVAITIAVFAAVATYFL